MRAAGKNFLACFALRQTEAAKISTSHTVSVLKCTDYTLN